LIAGTPSAGNALAIAALQDRKGLLDDWRHTHELLLSALGAPGGNEAAIAALVASTAAEQLARGAALEAQETYRQAAALAADLGHRDAELWARAGEATAFHYAGRSAEARPILETVALEADCIPEALWQSSVTLAQLLLDNGAAADAAACIRAAQTGVPVSLPPAWFGSFCFEAGRCQLELGDFAAAERSFDDALRVFRDLESPVWQAATLRQMGLLYGRRTDHAAALRTLEECLAVFESIGDLRWAGWVLGDLAKLDLRMGDTASARRRVRESRARLSAIGDRRGLARLDELDIQIIEGSASPVTNLGLGEGCDCRT
jgi:tetratricopeptide (TPR) repeat protein